MLKKSQQQQLDSAPCMISQNFHLALSGEEGYFDYITRENLNLRKLLCVIGCPK